MYYGQSSKDPITCHIPCIAGVECHQQLHHLDTAKLRVAPKSSTKKLSDWWCIFLSFLLFVGINIQNLLYIRNIRTWETFLIVNLEQDAKLVTDPTTKMLGQRCQIGNRPYHTYLKNAIFKITILLWYLAIMHGNDHSWKVPTCKIQLLNSNLLILNQLIKIFWNCCVGSTLVSFSFLA